MALQVRRASPIKVRIVTTLMMVFALVAQPLYGFVSAQIASAAPLTTYANTGFSGFTWATDRSAPSGGYDIVGDSLTMRVDNTLASSASGFYRTEGIKTAVPAGINSIKAELFVDSAWASKPIRAGIWGDGAGYPIIEYTNGVAGHTGWRVYDTNIGVWHNIPTTVTLGQWHSLEVAINPATNTYDFYVDSVKVGPSISSSYANLGGVIFNNFNSATGNTTDNYSVQWRNLSVGRVVTLAQRIAAATAGDTIDITENETVTGQIIVDKPLTITSTNGSIITTNGTGNLFRTTASGVTFSNLTFNKTDKASQHIVSIGADNAVISSNVFNGKYVLGDGEVARALEVSTISGLIIDGNTFNAFRQPAYINSGVSGKISNNSVNGTRGWVAHANTDLLFTGNTFSGNALDIALLAPLPVTEANNYDCSKIHAIKAANNNASIQNQTPGLSCAPTVPLNGAPHDTKIGTNDFWFTWNASSDEENAAVSYEFRSSQTLSNVGTAPDNSAAWKSDVLSSPTIHSTGAGDGTWYWQVRAIDATGNKSSWSSVWNVTLDTQKPVVAISSPSNNQALNVRTVNNKLNITGTASDQSNFNYYYCYVTTLGGTEVGVRDAKCQTAWALGTPFKTAFTQSAQGTDNGTLGSVDLTGVSNGSYLVHVAAKDKAGNTTETTQSFRLDNARPTIAVASLNVFNPSEFSVTATEADTTLSQVTGHIYNEANTTLVKNCSINVSALNVKSYTHTCSTSGLADGVYTIRSISSDVAGNLSISDSSTQFVIDKHTPSIGQVALSDTAINATDLNPTLTAMLSDATSNIDYAQYVIIDSNNENVGEWQNLQAADGSFDSKSEAINEQINTSSLVNGSYTLRLRTFDDAGNKKSGADVAFTVNRTLPNVMISGFSRQDNVIQPTVSVEGDSTGLTYAWTGAASPEEVTISDMSVQKPQFTVLKDGTYSYTLTTTNAAGNSTTDTFSFEYVAPFVPSEDDDVTIVAQLPTQPTSTSSQSGTFASVSANRDDANNNASITLADNNAAVLGTQDKKTETPLANTGAIAPSSQGWKIFGMAWFWWLAILAAAVAGWLWLAAAIRRRRGYES
jgi:hypothetical protein